VSRFGRNRNRKARSLEATAKRDYWMKCILGGITQGNPVDVSALPSGNLWVTLRKSQGNPEENVGLPCGKIRVKSRDFMFVSCS
jgi:hypothetical protein